MQVLCETLQVEAIDPDGKKFDNVSRALLKSPSSTIYLDYHSGLFTPQVADTVEIVVYKDTAGFDPDTIPEKYNYLMGNGVVYTLEPEAGDKLRIVTSFSGLLMHIVGKKNVFSELVKEGEFYIAARVL